MLARRAWSCSRRIDFARQKYGAELLVDVGWTHEWPTFILADEPHWLAFYEILLFTRGRGTVWLDARPLPVAPNRVLFTSPGQIRRWQARGVDGLCLFFTGGFVTEFFADPLFLHRLQFFHNPHLDPILPLGRPAERRLRERLIDMKREIGALRLDSPHVLRAILYELLVRLNREYAARHAIDPDTATSHAVFRFKQLVAEHASRVHRVGPYARRLGLTPGHLNDLTRRHLGQSAGEVIRAGLLTEARRWLAYSDRTIAQVAADLGFQDPSHFTRFFRLRTGVSPGGYRASIREKDQTIRR
jgi:AraC family transcriptional activator of pobA